jgi:hypothetical protein
VSETVPVGRGFKRVPDDVLIEAYARLGSIYKVGTECGIRGSTVHVRLRRLSIPMGNPVTDQDRDTVRHYYAATPTDDFLLADLAAILGRDRTTVCGIARSLGLTDMRRKVDAKKRRQIQERVKDQWSRIPHPRGMAGKKHTPEALAAISAASHAYWERSKANGTGHMSPEARNRRSDISLAAMPGKMDKMTYSRAKRGVREDVGPMHFRSAWEANYARYLNWLKARGDIDSWEYEPDTFWFDKIKRGVRSYLPDFRIHEKGRVYYVEVKGWMDDKSKTKIKRMAKYHPKVDLRVFGEKDYRSLKANLGRIIPNWE